MKLRAMTLAMTVAAGCGAPDELPSGLVPVADPADCAHWVLVLEEIGAEQSLERTYDEQARLIGERTRDPRGYVAVRELVWEDSRVIESAGTEGQAPRQIVYDLDHDERLLRRTDDRSVAEHTYDEHGVASSTYTSESYESACGYLRDDDGLVVTVECDGQTVTYTWSDARPTSQQQLNRPTRRWRWEDDRLVEVTQEGGSPAGLYSRFRYEPAGLVAATNGDANGATSSWTFARDAMGRVIEETYDQLGDGDIERTDTYGYDEEGRLSEALGAAISYQHDGAQLDVTTRSPSSTTVRRYLCYARAPREPTDPVPIEPIVDPRELARPQPFPMSR